MAEFEELRVNVALSDEASSKLGELKRTFAELGNVDFAKKLGDTNRQINEIEKAVRQLVVHFATGGPSMGALVNFAKALTPVALGIAVVYESVKATVVGLKREAEGLLNMATLARRVGESTAQYIKTMEVFERAGVPIERAGEQWERFVDAWNAMKRGDERGRVLFQELLQGLSGDEGRRAEQRLREILRVGNPEEAANMLRKWYDDVKKYYEQLADPARRARGPFELRRMLQTFGLPDLDRVKEAFTIVSEQEAADMDRMVEAAREFEFVSVSIEQDWKRIIQQVGTMLMEGPLGPILRLVDEALKREAKRMEGSQAPWWFEALGFTPPGMALKFALPDFWDWLGAGAAGQWKAPGAELAPGAPGNLAVPLMSTDYRKQVNYTEELVQQFRRFNALLSGQEKPIEDLGGSLGLGDISTGKTQSPAGYVNNDLSESAFNRLMRGGRFEGQYQTVVNAAHTQGISPSLVASILAFETGYGKSRAVKEYNNPAGLMAGGRGNRDFMKFDTIEEGISKAAEIQKRNYMRGGETIPGMGAIYAPVGAANDPGGTNKQWPGSVARLQTAMKGPGGFTTRAREVRAGREAEGAMASLTSTTRFGLMGTEMTPEEYSAAAPDLGSSASGRVTPFPTDEQMASAIASMTPWASVRGFQHLQRVMGTAKSGAAAPSRRDLDRSLADESGVEPRGNLNVRVNAPAGTEVKASGDGMFEGNVSLDRQMQLPTLQ
jgi:hypothetical protein